MPLRPSSGHPPQTPARPVKIQGISNFSPSLQNTLAGRAARAAVGGAIGAAGVATVNFGALPGASDARLHIADTGAYAGAMIQAAITAIATADHSADEHWIEELDVAAGGITPGVGFIIYMRARNLPLYGAWSVAWQRR
jgi:hypothetical protein